MMMLRRVLLGIAEDLYYSELFQWVVATLIVLVIYSIVF
jgi:hypothetical protein